MIKRLHILFILVYTFYITIYLLLNSNYFMLSLTQKEFDDLVKYIKSNQPNYPGFSATNISIVQAVLVNGASQAELGRIFSMTRQRINQLVKQFEVNYKKMNNIDADSVCFRVCVPKNKAKIFKDEIAKMVKNDMGLSLVG